MANVLDSKIVQSKFELQSRFYVLFRINTYGKGTKSQVPISYEFNSMTVVLLQGWLWH